ncbi:MAG: creatininase family protein [Solirubrobacteraceae bacterium]
MVLYELMRPEQIVRARAAAPVAYVPIGPLEWHGPHLPLGLDGLHAHEVAVRAAHVAGGVVLPTLFAGTETVRQPGPGPQSLATLGLPRDARVVGMDFPGHAVRSTYAEESSFGVTVRELVAGLLSGGFRIVILVNGHGAPNHQATLRRIAAEADRPGARRVAYHLAFLPDPGARGPGHAAREETAIALALCPGQVRCDLLPPLDVPLRYADHGIVDARAFDGEPAPGHALPIDDHPRAATADDGDALLRREGRALAERVLELVGGEAAGPTADAQDAG